MTNLSFLSLIFIVSADWISFTLYHCFIILINDDSTSQELWHFFETLKIIHAPIIFIILMRYLTVSIIYCSFSIWRIIKLEKRILILTNYKMSLYFSKLNKFQVTSLMNLDTNCRISTFPICNLPNGII